MKTFDISGFGDGYEECCQKMLTAGLKFLADRAAFDWDSYSQYKNVIGFMTTDGADGKALDKVLLNAADKLGGSSGAMHQAVVNHLHYISNHSYREWLEQAAKRRPEDVYEIDDPEREALVRSVEGEVTK